MAEAMLEERRALGQKLRALKDAIAKETTREFLARHPDWVTRYGERLTEFGIEDAGYHIDSLAGAVEANSPASFANYASWSAGVLGARGIAASALAENLEQIEAALKSRILPEQSDFLRTYFRAAIDACQAPSDEGKRIATGHRLDLAGEMFLRAILGGHRRPALNIVQEAMRGGTPMSDVYLHILQASLYEVGRLWETGEIPVATEHMATVIAQYVMAQLYAAMEGPEAIRGRAVITGVQGELHQVGANMVADYLELHGWNVRFLGTNMPHSGITKAIDEHKPAVLGISATTLLSVSKVVELIKDVRKRFGTDGPRILVGGAAFRHAPELYREIGADGFGPDLKAALELANGPRDDRVSHSGG